MKKGIQKKNFLNGNPLLGIGPETHGKVSSYTLLYVTYDFCLESAHGLVPGLISSSHANRSDPNRKFLPWFVIWLNLNHCIWIHITWIIRNLNTPRDFPCWLSFQSACLLLDWADNSKLVDEYLCWGNVKIAKPVIHRHKFLLIRDLSDILVILKIFSAC